MDPALPELRLFGVIPEVVPVLPEVEAVELRRQQRHLHHNKEVVEAVDLLPEDLDQAVEEQECHAE